MRHLLTLGLGCVLLASCASPPAAADGYGAQGGFVRHVRVRVAPFDTGSFEAWMTRCVEAAEAAALPRASEWLCYYEPPGRYWVLSFSPSVDGVAGTDSQDPLAGFAREVARAAGVEGLEASLETLEYEAEWKTVHRRKADWSSAVEMIPGRFPMARMMVRTVRPGKEDAFERALAARTAFFVEHDYPYPIEGFVTLEGAPGTALQVVFPTDWVEFHARTSFYEFVRRLDPLAREDYARRKQELMETMASAEYYDGRFKPDLSYAPSE